MTKVRTVRLSEDLWEYVRQEAEKQGTNKSEILRQIIVDKKGKLN
jgi:predicted DNA binding CopG/RHH family protein